MSAMLVLLRLGFRNLAQARRRNGLLGGAVAFTAVLLVLSNGIFQGVITRVINTSAALGSGHVHITGIYKPKRDLAMYRIKQLAPVMDFVRKNVPADVRFSDRIHNFTRIYSPADMVFCVFHYGVDIAAEPHLRETLQLAPLREYTDTDSDERVGSLDALADNESMVIFAEQARKLGVRVGDPVVLQMSNPGGVEGVVDAKVVAVVRDIPDFSHFFCFSNIETAKRLSSVKPESSTIVSIHMGDVDSANDFAVALSDAAVGAGFATIPTRLAQARQKLWSAQEEAWTGQRIEIGPWNHEMWWMDWRTDASRLIATLVAAALGLVVGLGAVSATFVSVRERTPEIGTLRAMGMSPSRVVIMVAIETLILAFVATVAGTIIGVIITLGLNAAHIKVTSETLRYLLFDDAVYLALTPASLVGIVILLPAVTLVASLWPAFKASRISPMAAIRDAL